MQNQGTRPKHRGPSTWAVRGKARGPRFFKQTPKLRNSSILCQCDIMSQLGARRPRDKLRSKLRINGRSLGFFFQPGIQELPGQLNLQVNRQTPMADFLGFMYQLLPAARRPGARCANADAYQSGSCPSFVKLGKLSTENFVGWVACDVIRCYIISRNKHRS